MNDLSMKTISSLTFQAVRKQTILANDKELQDGCFTHSLEQY